MFTTLQHTNLDFAGAKGNYASHSMHSYSAKFPPQLPKWAMEAFTQKGDKVFDPFAGSGTTLVEARLLGRNSYGTEIDPLSRLIAKVKSTPVDPLLLYSVSEQLMVTIAEWFAKLRRIRQLGGSFQQLDIGVSVPEFPNRDYWYYPETLEELTLLRHLVGLTRERDVRDFLYVVFSSIIYTKGKSSMANVMDLAHSRPHRVMKESPPDVEKAFAMRLKRLRKMMEEFWRQADHTVESRIIGADARLASTLKTSSIDLVFNSPPYVNAIDYQRGHKFSVFWLTDVLETSPDAYVGLAKDYVGSDRISKAECIDKANQRFNLDLIDEPVKKLVQADQVKLAGIVYSYFENMQLCMREMLRVVKPGHLTIIVVGPSNIKNVYIDTPYAISQLAETLTWGKSRFKSLNVIERKLDRDKRQMPITRGIFGDGMKVEHAVVLEKVMGAESAQ